MISEPAGQSSNRPTVLTKKRLYPCPETPTSPPSKKRRLLVHAAAVNQKRRDHRCPHDGCSYAASTEAGPARRHIDAKLRDQASTRICPHDGCAYL